MARSVGVRYARPVWVATAVVLLALATVSLVTTAITQPYFLATDITGGYLPGAQRFLDTGNPYTADQLAGPWTIGVHTFIHPPAALPLFVPFLFLPLALWWIIPLGLTAYAVWRLRPAPWTWPVMVLCLCWPRSTGALLTGNSDLWAMAAVAAGALWGWPVALLAVKPTFAPLALIGARRRSAWLAAVPGLLFVAVTLPLWIQWWAAIGNAGLGWTYSLLNLPLVLLPVVAWLGRSSRGTDPERIARVRRRGPVVHPEHLDPRAVIAGHDGVHAGVGRGR